MYSVSFPTFKALKRENVDFKRKIEKRLKKAYGFSIRSKPVSVEELNQFIIASLMFKKRPKSPQFISGQMLNLHKKHVETLLKKLGKIYAKDPELINTLQVMKDVEKKMSDKFDGIEKTKSLSKEMVELVKDLYLNGILQYWAFNDKELLVYNGNQVEIKKSEDGVAEIENIVDEMTLAVFGRKHVVLLAQQITNMNNTLNDVLSRLTTYIGNLSSFEDDDQKALMVELTSIFVGKIFGIREALNMALKQIRRYETLGEEIKGEATNHPHLIKLYEEWFDRNRLEEMEKQLESLEHSIGEHVEELRDLLSAVQKAKIDGKENSTVKEFVNFVVNVYYAFEQFRFTADTFQDIPSFTALRGDVALETGGAMKITPEPDNIITVRGIFKSFPLHNHTVYAIRGIDLDIKHGEFVAIMGPSGSGKTTLLNILSGLDRPDRGAVIVDNYDMISVKEKKLIEFRRNVASFIYQSYNLLPVLTSLENVRLPSDFGTKNPIGNKTQRAKTLLMEVGLDQFANTSPKNLSGGQQQRVTIARALQNQPKLIFADEPTGDLDHKTGEQIMDILTQINKERGVTLVLVTHDRAVAERADRIIHMQDGKILREEIPENVSKK